jgi:CheY-like chemotaxis protein
MGKLNCVLLVDDDKINNFINARTLKKLGICDNIKTCLNGEEALLYLTKYCSAFDQNYPELIILDNNMPEMNGIEFLELFNKLNYNKNFKLNIIVLTASNNPRDEEKLKELGIQGYLTKPLTEEKLMNVLELQHII